MDEPGQGIPIPAGATALAAAIMFVPQRWLLRMFDC